MPWTQSEVWPAVRPQIVERSREAKCPSRARRACVRRLMNVGPREVMRA